MKCQICGEPAMSGTARLCSPCRKAIKRARHETVSVAQPLPSRGAASIERRRARRAGASAANDAAQLIPPPLEARRSQFSVVFGVLAVVVCAVAYLGVQHLYAGGGDEHAAPSSPVLPTASAPVPAAVAVTPVASVTSPVGVTAETPPPPRPRPAAKPAPAPVIAQAPELTSPLNAAPSPPVVEPAPPPPPAPRAVPPPDRSQLINAGFGQCPRDNVIATAVCEQGVRLKYCEGYWGLLAQCPAGRANDYGQ